MWQTTERKSTVQALPGADVDEFRLWKQLETHSHFRWLRGSSRRHNVTGLLGGVRTLTAGVDLGTLLGRWLSVPSWHVLLDIQEVRKRQLNPAAFRHPDKPVYAFRALECDFVMSIQRQRQTPTEAFICFSEAGLGDKEIIEIPGHGSIGTQYAGGGPQTPNDPANTEYCGWYEDRSFKLCGLHPGASSL
ncbi:hypothetical protein VTK56DRAFT_943 [Thermocarpiscus australiensis]